MIFTLLALSLLGRTNKLQIH
ncbi:hypothetical protein LINGRAPRIM_LOCUS65 [Linum grandiflorum]